MSPKSELLLVVFYLLGTVTANHSDLPLMLNDFVKRNSPVDTIYLVSCWEYDYGKHFHKTLQNLTMISNFDSHQADWDLKQPANIFVDLFCPKSLEMLRKAKAGQLFTPSFVWLLLGPSPMDALASFRFPITSNVFLFERNPYGYSTKKIYGSSLKLDLLNETFVGYWCPDDGYTEARVDRSRFRQVTDAEVAISYVVDDNDTISHLDNYKYNILIDSATKYNYAILQHIYYLLNASKMEVFRNQFNTTFIDGINHLGMLEDVKRGQYLIGGTPILFISSEVDEYDLLDKTVNMEKKFIFRATPHSYIHNVFTLPFDSYVWYSCFGLMAAIFVVAYIVQYWEWTDPVFRKFLVPRLTLRPHPVDIFLMEIGSAAQQGFESEPQSNAGRIVFIFTLISLMFLYTSFSANIVALLQSTSERLNDLEHLLDSRIPVGFENNVSMEYFEAIDFENKNREFWNKLHKPVFYGIEEGVRKIKEEFFAFYADTSSVYKYVSDWFMESEKCGLREIPFQSTHVDYWLIMKKNNSYKDLFRAGLQKINEVGLRSREYRRMFTGKPQCDSDGGTFESVGIADSYGAFLFMAIGAGQSLMLLILEVLWNKYMKHKQIKTMNVIHAGEGDKEEQDGSSDFSEDSEELTLK